VATTKGFSYNRQGREASKVRLPTKKNSGGGHIGQAGYYLGYTAGGEGKIVSFN